MKAYVFPGQGAQFSGMGKDLYEGSEVAKELFKKANEILGFRITDIMFEGTADELKETKVTIHSTTLQEDFNILFNAINLATSGVGTFPIAAALLSNKLRNFYYTDLYSDEHLNPKMVTNKRVNHFKYKVEELGLDKESEVE